MYFPLFLWWYRARCGASKSILSRSLYSLFIRSTIVKNTVCLLIKFVLPVSILNSWWSVSWLHIRCEKCTRRNCSEFTHCPVMKDQWNSVLNDLEELGDKEFLVLMDQYNIKIFSCFLRLSPLYTSTFHHTNVEIAQNRSEDNPFLLQNSIAPSSSRGRWPWTKKSTQSFWHWVSDE